MNRLRVTAFALTALVGVLGGCGDTGGDLLAPETVHRNDIFATEMPARGGGWADNGHESATVSDSTVSRGGGWVGSGH